MEGAYSLKACQDTLLTFENHFLEEEMTFSDLFEDSGVGGGGAVQVPRQSQAP